MFHLGKWGSICDDEWDIREATVICRELGFDDVARGTHNSMFGPARRKCNIEPVTTSAINKQVINDWLHPNSLPCTNIKGAKSN